MKCTGREGLIESRYASENEDPHVGSLFFEGLRQASKASECYINFTIMGNFNFIIKGFFI